MRSGQQIVQAVNNYVQIQVTFTFTSNPKIARCPSDPLFNQAENMCGVPLEKTDQNHTRKKWKQPRTVGFTQESHFHPIIVLIFLNFPPTKQQSVIQSVRVVHGGLPLSHLAQENNVQHMQFEKSCLPVANKVTIEVLNSPDQPQEQSYIIKSSNQISINCVIFIKSELLCQFAQQLKSIRADSTKV